MAVTVPTVTIDDLRAFHEKHFPCTPVPETFLCGAAHEPAEDEYDEEVDELGYYPDGVKRTLTDEQIAIFRHSEIQAILRERGQRLSEDVAEDVKQLKDALPKASSEQELDTATSIAPSPSLQPNQPTEPAALQTKCSDKIQDGRVSKSYIPQWATHSAKSKAKNKRQRNNYKANKRERKTVKREVSERSGADATDDGVSDEWDPWHQANGPDNQKADTVDLDY